jgi:hypothetical protein
MQSEKTEAPIIDEIAADMGDEDDFIRVTDNSVRIGGTTVTSNGNGVEVELKMGRYDFDNPATVTADVSVADTGLDFGVAAEGTLGELDVSAGIRSESSRDMLSGDADAVLRPDGGRLELELAKGEAFVEVTSDDLTRRVAGAVIKEADSLGVLSTTMAIMTGITFITKQAKEFFGN